MSSKKNTSGSPVRRAPQYRMNAGRHREASVTVTEAVSSQANAGARLAAIGVLGSTTALAAPGMAAAATWAALVRPRPVPARPRPGEMRPPPCPWE